MKTYIRPEPQNQTAFPIARPGYPILFAAAFVTAVLALLELTVPALLALLGTLFVAWFFRDPDRMVPEDKDSIVSPADGRILKAEVIAKAPYYDGPSLLISIFMSVFNVHVNRIPFEGSVEKIDYQPGKFFAANLDKSSTDNERNAVFLKTDDGKTMTVVQIAGLIARRIICNVNAGDPIIRGQRFGMICFGSRVDVYLPPDTEPLVSVGQNVSAGSSVLARLKL